MDTRILTYNCAPVYVHQKNNIKTLVIPIRFVLNIWENKIYIKTQNSGMYPIEDVRFFNRNDEKDFPDFVSQCILMDIKKLDLDIVPQNWQ